MPLSSGYHSAVCTSHLCPSFFSFSSRTINVSSDKRSGTLPAVLLFLKLSLPVLEPLRILVLPLVLGSMAVSVWKQEDIKPNAT